jgi:hypothetical protein
MVLGGHAIGPFLAIHFLKNFAFKAARARLPKSRGTRHDWGGENTVLSHLLLYIIPFSCCCLKIVTILL